MANCDHICHECAARENPEMEARFWAKVDKTGDCWLWAGYRDRRGYGTFNVGRTPKKAHRVAYELVKGPIPAGLVIDHRCWNPPCVNPDHLRAVTPAANSANKNPKGRKKRAINLSLRPDTPWFPVGGVSWDSERRMWRVKLTLNGTYHWGGRFADREDAEAALDALQVRVVQDLSIPEPESVSR